MEWLELNQVDARERYESLLENDFRDSYILSTLTSQSEKKLRYQLTDAYEEIISQINDGINNGKLNYSKKKYYTDCYFGIELFKILRSFKFQLHDASNINIWRYISLYIIPDLVLERHGKKEKYFYSIPNRIWLRTIWWYCMLSMQTQIVDNKKVYAYDKTLKVIQEFNTDYILNIVDRSGSDGFRIQLVREIITQFYERREEIKKYFNNDASISDKEFPRKIMLLNVARLEVYEPMTYDGGIKGYVKDLFDFYLVNS